MLIGDVTGYVDAAQLVLYVFWAFFFGLVYYLQQESKREGFPLESDLPNGETIITPGLVGMPKPKTYLLPHGGEVTVPNDKKSPQTLNATRSHGWIGAPLEPVGNPLLAGVGPGSWSDRADVPDLTFEGHVKIVPLRAAEGFDVAKQDNDPRGMPLVAADGEIAGTVKDLWVDKSEMMFRFFEVSVPTVSGHRDVLVPTNFTRVKEDRVTVRALLSHQFGEIPGTRKPEEVTMLEEEKIMAYFGAGTLYADPERQEPLI